MSKIIEDVKIEGTDRKGYTVSYYEWQEGKGRDCGLNRTSTPFATIEEAREYATSLQSREAFERKAWKWATGNQGYEGSFADWCAMDADEREEYEQGAAGIPTA